MSTLAFVSLDRLDHPLLEDWKHLYHDAFPASERMTWGFFERVIPAEDRGHFIWAATLENKFVALASYGFDETESGKTMFLWYLATVPALRNQGVGQQVMAQIKQEAKENGCSAVVLEVSIPEEATSEEDAKIDQRRIGFYQRQGAFLIGGIRYIQSVDQPNEKPIPMHLMLIPLQELDIKAVIHIIEAMGAKVIGEITLKGMENK
jgi:GNAT superfamily N-acetyltransferase